MSVLVGMILCWLISSFSLPTGTKIKIIILLFFSQVGVISLLLICFNLQLEITTQTYIWWSFFHGTSSFSWRFIFSIFSLCSREKKNYKDIFNFNKYSWSIFCTLPFDIFTAKRNLAHTKTNLKKFTSKNVTLYSKLCNWTCNAMLHCRKVSSWKVSSWIAEWCHYLR